MSLHAPAKPLAMARMQAAHDAWQAESEVDVSNIPTIRAA
jgi:hypothetical protein